MTAEVLAWFCDIFTNADGNPSEQIGSSLGATGFFSMCFCLRGTTVVANPAGL